MIDEQKALAAAKAYADKNFENCWDEAYHEASLVEIDNVQYWEIDTNIAPPLDAPFNEQFFPSPIKYYVNPETGECIGYKGHRHKKIYTRGR
ncbi:hypothetical protein Q5705_13530 [Kosakonia sp. H02]|nr:hypothetical protein Q5705_13530 [Kosakonia sp. H02]